MLSEGSSVKGSPEDKQASAPYIRGSAKISWRVTLAHFTGPELQTKIPATKDCKRNCEMIFIYL